MKKTRKALSLLCAAAMCGSALCSFQNESFDINMSASAAGGNIEINAENFPDDVFREYISIFDTNGDGFFSSKEIAEATAISASEMGIIDLTGVEYFTALEYLDCSDNQLESLDLRALRKKFCKN